MQVTIDPGTIPRDFCIFASLMSFRNGKYLVFGTAAL